MAVSNLGGQTDINGEFLESCVENCGLRRTPDTAKSITSQRLATDSLSFCSIPIARLGDRHIKSRARRIDLCRPGPQSGIVHSPSNTYDLVIKDESYRRAQPMLANDGKERSQPCTSRASAYDGAIRLVCALAPAIAAV